MVESSSVKTTNMNEKAKCLTNCMFKEYNKNVTYMENNS